MDLQSHLINAQDDLCEQHRKSYQGGYTGGANTMVRIQDESSNLDQVTVEYWAVATNLTATNSKLTNQVALYANLLSTKEANNVSLQRDVLNL